MLGRICLGQFNLIDDIIQDAKNLSLYFHGSVERTQKLKNVSLTSPDEFQKYIRYPAYFEIRNTLDRVHARFVYCGTERNWKASIHYFVNEKEDGFEKRWLSYDRIHLLAFLNLFTAFKRSCESDSVTLAEILSIKNQMLGTFLSFKCRPCRMFLLRFYIDKDDRTVS